MISGLEGEPPALTRQRAAALKLADDIERAVRTYKQTASTIPSASPVTHNGVQLREGRDVASHLELDLVVERDELLDVLGSIKERAIQPLTDLDWHALEWHREDLR